jgi:pimeloyl-ACP methyl ester carboxylesterase
MARGILGFVVLTLTMGGCADSLLLLPPKGEVAAPSGAERRMVAVGIGAVEVWVKPAAKGRADVFVLEFTGNAARAEYVVAGSAARFAGVNAEVWAVNYPGYGGSSGKAKLASIPPAALAAFDAITKEAGDRPVIVVGRSIGTTAALYVASKRKPAGVVLHSPVPLNQMMFGQFGWWSLWILPSIVAPQVPGDLQAMTTSKKCTAPAVFIVTERDELVSPKNQRRVIDAYGGPKDVIPLPEADHNAAASEDEETAIRAAISRLIGQSK